MPKAVKYHEPLRNRRERIESILGELESYIWEDESVDMDIVANVVSALDLGLSMTTAAELAMTSPQVLGRLVKDFPPIAQAFARAAASPKLRAVLELDKLIERGNQKAIEFWLRKRCEEFGDNPDGTKDTLEREDSYL